MHFGEPLDDERFMALIAPDDQIRTVMTADVYGTGEADRMLGRAIEGRRRGEMCVVGAVGHDFYEGERDGAKGFPRFTDPRLRDASEYAGYLRMATERSLERVGIDSFDLLLLHNPDRTGYTSEMVWEGMAALREAGLTRLIGVAPGPANGFTLDVIDCLERFGALLDWAMIILNPLEPWPGELCLDAAAAARVNVITRVVDYGGLFFDDLRARAGTRAPGPPELPARRLDRAGPRAARADAAGGRAHRAHDDPARVPVEHGARAGRLRRADADPGGGRGRAAGREQARGAGGAPHRGAADRRRTSTRSARSATTPAAWRSRARAPSTPARSAPIAGTSTITSPRSPSAGGSLRTASSSR